MDRQYDALLGRPVLPADVALLLVDRRERAQPRAELAQDIRHELHRRLHDRRGGELPQRGAVGELRACADFGRLLRGVAHVRQFRHRVRPAAGDVSQRRVLESVKPTFY